jgi:hypothetical protein
MKYNPIEENNKLNYISAHQCEIVEDTLLSLNMTRKEEERHSTSCIINYKISD